MGRWEDLRKTKNERRKVLRIRIDLPISLIYQGKTYTSKTFDISRFGASCTVNESLPEFSRLEASIKFPFDTQGKNSHLDVPVIVVNSRKISQKSKKCRIGFYYDDLTKHFQENIEILLSQLKKKIKQEKKLQKIDAGEPAEKPQE